MPLRKAIDNEQVAALAQVLSENIILHGYAHQLDDMYTGLARKLYVAGWRREERVARKIRAAVAEIAGSYTNEEGSAIAALPFKAELDQWFHYEYGEEDDDARALPSGDAANG